jgi:peptidoglycan pentaglycine glycine transferase (the first glycine)
MEDRILNFIQSNSPDGGFLQSEYWRMFQESVGRKTFQLEEKDESGNTLIFSNAIAHRLPLVGDYIYVPRGPIINQKSKIKKFLNNLISLAKENNAGWIRIEPNSREEHELISENLPRGVKMKKSAVDMQPREILVMDISGSEEEILAKMKQKTRYNIRLAEKKGVHVSHDTQHITHNIVEFLRLVKITAKRDGITAHPENYYRKMLETIPSDILRLYIAEYEGKVICANLVLFFEKTATYMHGASDNEYRNVMAPYLLQWRQMKDAIKAGCEKYDFGGVKISHNTQHISHNTSSWEGITRFKQGFAPEIKSIEFPGCYDIILNPIKYSLYRLLRKIKP